MLIKNPLTTLTKISTSADAGGYVFIKQTHSTNALLREMLREYKLPEKFLVRTDFQMAGKGQSGNSWESEAGKNLLFSMVLYPSQIAIEEQFIISQLVGVAIKKTLDKYADGFSIKWPNDIYWNDKKIGGILIENSLQSGKIKWTVIGVGLNINQKAFISDAPNPVSLCQITGKRIARKPVLNDICNNIGNLYILMDYSEIRKGYSESLYRKESFHAFRAEGETLEARIDKIYPDGKLELETKAGEKRGFYFKEVEYVIS